MAEQDVPSLPVTTEREETPRDAALPAWTYDSWFAGWYRAPHEAEKQATPALAD